MAVRFDSNPVADAVIRGLPGGDAAAANYQNSLFYGPLVTDDKAWLIIWRKRTAGNPTRKISWEFAALKRRQL